MNGAWMAWELARHGYQIGPGTLYPLMHRLESAGLLTSRSRVVDGHRRREYTITRKGRTALRRLRAAVTELSGEVITDTRRR